MSPTAGEAYTICRRRISNRSAVVALPSACPPGFWLCPLLLLSFALYDSGFALRDSGFALCLSPRLTFQLRPLGRLLAESILPLCAGVGFTQNSADPASSCSRSWGHRFRLVNCGTRQTCSQADVRWSDVRPTPREGWVDPWIRHLTHLEARSAVPFLCVTQSVARSCDGRSDEGHGEAFVGETGWLRK